MLSCISLESEVIANSCAKIFKLSNLSYHTLPSHANRPEDGPRTLCPCPLSQTHLLSFANIKVKEAILKPGGNLVDVLGVGGTAVILPASNQGHVIGILNKGEVCCCYVATHLCRGRIGEVIAHTPVERRCS